MKDLVRVGVIQMNAQLDKSQNLDTAERLIREAAAAGAELVVLPELFQAYGPLSEVVAQAETIPGPSSRCMADLARELRLVLCSGSICEQATEGKGFNTSLLLGTEGEIIARYRKMHLFDVEIPGQVSSRESNWMCAGDEVSVAATSVGVLGQAICYDLRFPELFRAMAARQMEILLLPSAFTAVTGRMHWETLVRARAIENQCFVLAANQFGAHGGGQISYGRSMIVDPWGVILAEAPLDTEALLVADLSREALAQVRRRIPALQHRRL